MIRNGRRWFGVVLGLGIVGLVLLLSPDFYLAVRLRCGAGIGLCPMARVFDLEDEPRVNPSQIWQVNFTTRLSACDNRPGLKKIYVTVLDEEGAPLADVGVRFDVAGSRGIAYDHPNVWGVSDENGYVEWKHLGVPTRYMLWMGDERTPLIENIRTDLGYGYCRPPGTLFGGWRPVNRPGIYSYRIEIQRK